MKKLALFMMFFLALLFIVGCGMSSIKMTQNNDADKNIKKVYGKSYLEVAKVTKENIFQLFIKNKKDGILNNRNMPEQEQAKKIKAVEAIKFNQNQYFLITSETNKKLSNSELLTIDIRAKNNISVLDKSLGLSLKEIKIEDSALGQQYLYQYFFFTVKPLTKDFYKEVDLPATIWVQLPNDFIIKYVVPIE